MVPFFLLTGGEKFSINHIPKMVIRFPITLNIFVLSVKLGSIVMILF